MNGIIAWFVHNPIAANLLMAVIVIGGITGIPALEKQFFPEVEPDIVGVSMSYPGAGPKEVEEQICTRIEEAVHDLTGVKEIRSTARDGGCDVSIEAESGYDLQRLTSAVKTRVDAINSFPAEAERPVVSEEAYRHRMIMVTVAGAIGENNLKVLGETLRDELAALPYVSIVDISSPRPWEVSVEVSEYTLRHYGLRFDDVVNAIRSSSLNLPAGSIKAESGDIRLQTRGQAYQRAQFESIVLLSKRDGTRVLLGDVAQIVDGFAEQNVRSRFNDKPSHNLQVYVTSHPDVLKTSKTVRDWAEQVKPRLPEGVEIAVWRDQADPFTARVTTLVKNGASGLLLVFLVLLLFLRPLLALWVCVGIAVSFLGTLFLLPYFGVRLDMLSLFAFLLILGIVVDDAIIVGESIHTRQSSGQWGEKGAILGAQAVVKPVMFAVVSTMIFFVPMWLMPGDMAAAAFDIPTVVILALCFSLLECTAILPSHLSHIRAVRRLGLSGPAWLERLEQLRARCAGAMVQFAAGVYRPFLEKCLHSNLLTSSVFLVALLFTVALYGGGWLKSSFFPKIIADRVVAEVELQDGVAFEDTLQRLHQIERAALRMKQEYNANPRWNAAGPALGFINSYGFGNRIRIWVTLENKELDIAEVSAVWRDYIGDLGEVENFSMDYTLNETNTPIKLVLASPSVNDLAAVAEELRTSLLSYPGVYNVNDTLQSPRAEIELELKPAAENLGITRAELARQVRRAFYGAEAQRIPRVSEDVKVMVRYPEAERISVDNLQQMRIRAPDGHEVPFDAVAGVRYVPGYQTIERLNRKRTLEVTAEVLPDTDSPRSIINEILRRDVPRWQGQYPGLSLALDGELEEEQAFASSLLKFMGLSMLVIYGLMAIPFRSYWQPALILTAVPFGVMGAILGHIIMGRDLSMFSLLGVMACAGVVVNDNLVLIDRINQLRAQGLSVLEALLQGGQDRFRPIILTSVTTFIGLLPIMMETSVQAQFLIPMVISLAFGVLFATTVTLVLVPTLYLFGERAHGRLLERAALLLRFDRS